MKKWMSYAVVLLWLAAAVNHMFGGAVTGEARVVEAFGQADFLEMECSVSLSGYLNEADYGAEERAEILRKIAGELGLWTGYTVETSEKEGLCLTQLSKEMPRAQVNLRLATAVIGHVDGEPTVANYFYADLDFYQSAETALYYKKKLEQLKETYELGGTVTMLLTGVFEGNLDMAARDAVAGHLLDQMGAREQEAHRGDDLYTIYAYTENWPQHTTVSGKSVNVNVAFSYHERENQTLVYLGSPLILESY